MIDQGRALDITAGIDEGKRKRDVEECLELNKEAETSSGIVLRMKKN